MRNKLIVEKTLVEENNKLILKKDIVLSSSSYAAALVAGTSRSGPQSWKNSKGIGPGSTVSALMINGVFVFSGVMAMFIKLK